MFTRIFSAFAAAALLCACLPPAPALAKTGDSWDLARVAAHNKLVTDSQKTDWATLRLYLMPTNSCPAGNDAVRRKAREITAGKPTDYERIRAVHEWIAKTVIYSNTYCKGASTIYDWDFSKKLYGDCEDVSNLAIAFLRSLNIPAKQAIGVGAFGRGGRWVEAAVLRYGSYVKTELRNTAGSGGHGWVSAFDAESGRWVISDPTWDLQHQYAAGTHSPTLNFDPDLTYFSNDHYFDSYMGDSGDFVPVFLPLDRLSDSPLPQADISYKKLADYFGITYLSFAASAQGGTESPTIEFPTFSEYLSRFPSGKASALDGAAPVTAAAAPGAKAVVNGQAKTTRLVTINGKVCYRLCDLAALLAGTNKRFAAQYSEGDGWALATGVSGAALCHNDAPTGTLRASYSDAKLTLNGKVVYIRAFEVNGRGAYIEAADLAYMLDFSLTRRGADLVINTSKGYFQ